MTHYSSDGIAREFEARRGHLSALAYRMLGSVGEAEDAVQEAWLRLARTDTERVQNLSAWLTTVVARVCLDALRSRQSRREEPLNEAFESPDWARGPEDEAILADTVGLALLVVLDRLSPSERLAFVLHDLFGVTFEEIAPIVERTPAAARQLASRARRRVRGVGEDAAPPPGLSRQREVAGAFFAASRGGDFEALLLVLDPNVVLRADGVAVPPLGVEVRGARAVAERASLASGRGAWARLALVDGAVGIVVAPRGQLQRVLVLSESGGKITRVEVIAEPERLRRLEIAVLDD